METRLSPLIVSAERAQDGILVEFDDGRAALYPTALLLSVFPQAAKVEAPEPDEE